MLRSIIQSAVISGVNLRSLENISVLGVKNKSWLAPIYGCKNRNTPKLQHSVVGSMCTSRHSINAKVDNRPNNNASDIINTSPNIYDHENKEEDLGLHQDMDQDSTELFECIDLKEITGGDEKLLDKFKLLLLEVDVLRQDGERIPKTLSTDQWKELFSLKTRSQRLKMLSFVWLNEMKKLSDKKKKERKKIVVRERLDQEKFENEKNDHIKYGFQGSTIFLRVYDTAINVTDNNRLVQAMQFGQDIVIDCGYNMDMSPMENKLCAKQLNYMFAENRIDKEPFNLHFCNMDKESILFKQLKKFFPTLEDPEFPLIIREENYLDIFPKERLVYLTPHCRTELQTFSHEDVYIIGALVDKHNNEPLSLAKAKRQGIRMAQLPLDRYLQWNQGTKSLTINQVLKILLDVRTTGDWNVAMRNVPTRKLRQPGEPPQDVRQFYRRGTTLMPPRFIRNKRFY